ncbi:MAG: RibD family protein, partial [Paracoccaceae bacterium]
SLDGRSALADGRSRWITGLQARRMVHAMRMAHDGVLIGVGTAIADDADLRAREMGAGHQPVRIVMDSRLRLPLTSRLVMTAGETPVWIIHADGAPEAAGEALRKAGVQLIAAGGELTARAALLALADRGLTRVLCEGGATLAASLLAADLVDEVALFTAGLAIGATGHPTFGALPLIALPDAARFTLRDSRIVGPDSLSIWGRNGR